MRAPWCNIKGGRMTLPTIPLLFVLSGQLLFMVAVAIHDALIAFKHLRQCIDESFSHDTQIFPDARN